MKVRRFRIDRASVHGESAILEGDAAHYVRSVLRLRQGQIVELFDGDGNEWVGPIERLEKHLVQVRIEQHHFTAPREEGPRVILLFSLARGSHTDLAIQKVTELGVSEVRLFTSERTVAVPRPGGDPVRIDRLERIATDAARQSGRAHVPPVRPPQPFRDVLDALEGGETRLMLWEGEHQVSLAGALGEWDTTRPLVLLVGPEGGFTRDEVEAATEVGFVPVHVGPFILRTETAAIAAVAAARILVPEGDGPGGRPREVGGTARGSSGEGDADDDGPESAEVVVD